MTVRFARIWRVTRPTWLFLMLIGLILLTLTALILLCPVWIVMAARWYSSERRFARRLQRSGRILSGWDVRERLTARQGSLMLEADPDRGAVRRVWWAPDNLIKLYPEAPWATVDDLRRISDADDDVSELSERARLCCEQFIPRLSSQAHLVEMTPEEMGRFLEDHQQPPPQAAVVLYPSLTSQVKRDPS